MKKLKNSIGLMSGLLVLFVFSACNNDENSGKEIQKIQTSKNKIEKVPVKEFTKLEKGRRDGLKVAKQYYSSIQSYKDKVENSSGVSRAVAIDVLDTVKKATCKRELFKIIKSPSSDYYNEFLKNCIRNI